jgi:hypothetical protein
MMVLIVSSDLESSSMYSPIVPWISSLKEVVKSLYLLQVKT